MEVNGRTILLSTNCYPGAVHPEGYKTCRSFAAEPWPTWTYDCAGVSLQREVLCVQGRDLVIVRWLLLKKTKSPVTLLVRPMLSGRDYHSAHHANAGLDSNGTGRRCAGPVGKSPSEGTAPPQKKDSVKGRAMRDPLL